MTFNTADAIGTITDRRTGEEWAIVSATKTSDGFLIGTGVLIDPETGDQAEDEDGWPITKSLFLGSAN
jgi:hypothetical protein